MNGSTDIQKLQTAAAYAQYHAAKRPDALAVEDRGETYAYRRFAEDIGKTVTALTEAGLTRGDIAVVEFDGLYRPWLLQIACECIGVATCHYDSPEGAQQTAALMRNGAIAIFAGDKPHNAERFIHADQSWWQTTGRKPVSELPLPPPPETVIRIACSSGTTGRAKLIPQTLAQIDFRCRAYEARLGYSDRSRHLVGLGFSVQVDHLHALACLRAGGACVYGGSYSSDVLVSACNPTHMVLLPVFVPPLVNETLTKSDLVLSVVGGHLSADLRSQLLARVAGRVIETYAINEAGSIAEMQANGTGTVLPGVTVEIVDDEDTPLGFGTAGHIRVKSPAIGGGYLHDPEASARNYRNGWFYPGDTGVLEESGVLRFLGRSDDLVNLRGLKLLATDIENALTAHLAVDDAGVVSVEDNEGYDGLCIAVVISDETVKLDALYKRIETILPEGTGHVRLMRLSGIPRTGTGKVRRRYLKQIIEDHLAKQNTVGN